MLHGGTIAGPARRAGESHRPAQLECYRWKLVQTSIAEFPLPTEPSLTARFLCANPSETLPGTRLPACPALVILTPSHWLHPGRLGCGFHDGRGNPDCGLHTPGKAIYDRRSRSCRTFRPDDKFHRQTESQSGIECPRGVDCPRRSDGSVSSDPVPGNLVPRSSASGQPGPHTECHSVSLIPANRRGDNLVLDRPQGSSR